MGAVTTYICDVSGKQGQDKSEFVGVRITSTLYNANGQTNNYSGSSTPTIEKLLHREVALKLGLLLPKKDEPPQPAITLESQLTTVLKDYIAGLVHDEVSDAVSNIKNY